MFQWQLIYISIDCSFFRERLQRLISFPEKFIDDLFGELAIYLSQGFLFFIFNQL